MSYDVKLAAPSGPIEWLTTSAYNEMSGSTGNSTLLSMATLGGEGFHSLSSGENL